MSEKEAQAFHRTTIESQNNTLTVNDDSVGRSRRSRCLELLILVSFCIWVVLNLRLECLDTKLDLDVVEEDFDWTSINPSEKLEWVKCYERLECARLSVPLDYSDPSGEKAAVALAKAPSRIPPDQDGYRGPILFNPGGPGGSGVSFIRGSFLNNFRTILGDDYDLIGFDPRGIGSTTPTLSVFHTQIEMGSWALHKVPLTNSTTDALGLQFGRAQILGTLADERARHVAEHMSTPTVARDMLSITKAHGRDKLLYWGFSYGTILGATYAAMFPENIERLVIDGVENSNDYYATRWSNNLRDTEAALLDLYSACNNAGPESCPLYENSTSSIQARVSKVLEELKVTPIPFHSSAEGTYDVVDSSIVKPVIFRSLYNAHTVGRSLMTALAELERGNALPIWTMSTWSRLRDVLKCDCPSVPPKQGRETMTETIAIACGDGDVVEGGLTGLQDHFEMLAKKSTFADVWMDVRTYCAGWKIRTKEKFTGSFERNTSYPILLIGNALDPVTPVWNAHKMSQGFNNSVVLTQNSSGHCSIAATSLCTMKSIREYFRNGTVPPKGTVCEVESTIFGQDLAVDLQVLSDGDRELLQAARGLQENYFIPLLH